MLELKLNIHGKVQRVGFRASILKYIELHKLPITGFVKNLPDGTVELVAQGELEDLKELHRFAAKGPPMAEVRDITEELIKISERTFNSFEFL